jgi:hypothetical protein
MAPLQDALKEGALARLVPEPNEAAFHRARLRPSARWARRNVFEQNYPTAVDAGVLEGLLSMLSLQVTDLARTVDSLSTRIRELEATIQEQSERPIERLIELPFLRSEKYELRRPILVNIEEYEDEVLARWPVVELTARGQTEFIALSSLQDAIVDLHDELDASDEENLGKTPRAWLTILRETIQSKTSAKA